MPDFFASLKSPRNISVKAVYKADINSVQKVHSFESRLGVFINTFFMHLNSLVSPTVLSVFIPPKKSPITSLANKFYTLYTGLINRTTSLNLNNLIIGV